MTLDSKLLYEARPYFYGAISFYALVLSKPNTLMIVSGVMMGLCCLIVSSMRYQYRKEMIPLQRARSRLGHQNFSAPKKYHGHNKYFIE